MSESYYDQMRAAKRAAYVNRVVSQPTQQSDVKAKRDKTSPTGIRQVKK